MRWNVEIRISPNEIEQIGKDAALKQARIRAWMQAARELAPARSLTLLSEEAGERYRMPFLLLRFAVDE